MLPNCPDGVPLPLYSIAPSGCATSPLGNLRAAATPHPKGTTRRGESSNRARLLQVERGVDGARRTIVEGGFEPGEARFAGLVAGFESGKAFLVFRDRLRLRRDRVRLL